MHVFPRGVAGHASVGRRSVADTIHGRAPPPSNTHAGPPPGKGPSFDPPGRNKGKGHQDDKDRNTPPPTPQRPPPNPPPSNPPPPYNPPPFNPPPRGNNGPPAPVPPAIVPNIGTGSGDTPSSSRSPGSPTTSSIATPSTVTPDRALGADNVGSGDKSSSSNTGVANAGDVPTNTQDSFSQISGGYGTLTAGDSSQTSTAADPTADAVSATAAENRRISPGAVAGIVFFIVALFLFLLLFLCRRRARARRVEQANSWWFHRNRTSQTYGDRNSAEVLPSPGSARSSFATTLDHSVHVLPPLPPMAEVGRANAGSRHHTEAPDNRFSIGSNHSENSQFLFVDFPNSVDGHASASGHSPSESFAFPKPPSPIADRASAYSRPSSNRVSPTMTRHNSHEILSPAFASMPPTPTAPRSLTGDDPFASNPFGDNNPFEDPHHPPVPSIAFPGTETTHQPFQTALQHEVTVSSMDCVRESGPTFTAAKHNSIHGDEGIYTAI